MVSRQGNVFNQIIGVLMGILMISIVVGVMYIVGVKMQGALNQTSGSNVPLGSGSGSQTANQAFSSLLGYLNILTSFVGIIILLLIVGVLFVALGDWAG